jgi:hypothetical protein
MWTCFAVFLSIVTLAPLLVIDVPPIQDYPNHLARLVILALGAGDPVLSHMYRTHWRIIPNLAIDLLMPPLLQVLPVYLAGRLLLALVLLFPSVGVVIYSRTLFRRHLVWPLFSTLTATSLAFMLGFLNCLISLGAAFLVAAIWVRWRDHAPFGTALICGCAASLVFFCHLSGLILLFVLIVSQEAETSLLGPQSRRALLSASLKSGFLIFTTFGVSLLLYAMSPLDHLPSGILRMSVPVKIFGLTEPFVSYATEPGAVTFACLALFILLCLRTGRWEMPPRSLIAFSLLMGLYVVAPYGTAGATFVDTRFVIMAALVVFAGFTPCRLPRSAMLVAMLVCAVLTVWRSGSIAENWARHRPELRQFRAAIGGVAPGTRVLVVGVPNAENPRFWLGPGNDRHPLGARLESHLAGLLVIERHAAWPLLFALPSQQPIEALGRYRFGPPGEGMPPDYHILLTDRPVAAALKKAPYLQNWRDHFDDVLVLDADAIVDLAQITRAGLVLVSDTGFAALFRLRPETKDTPTPMHP